VKEFAKLKIENLFVLSENGKMTPKENKFQVHNAPHWSKGLQFLGASQLNSAKSEEVLLYLLPRNLK
jgi:hypothetical protein